MNDLNLDLSQGMISPAAQDWDTRADMASAVIRELESPSHAGGLVLPSVRGAEASPKSSSPIWSKKVQLSPEIRIEINT